jgi:Na+/proline symporter
VTLGALGVCGVAVYLLLTLGVAEMARRRRRDASPADHFLAGRSLGPLVLLLTLYATAYSGNSLLGFPGEAYRAGFVWIMSTGFMSAILVLLHVLVPVLRPAAVTHGFVSPGDWIRHRFGDGGAGRGLRLVVAVLMVIACGNFLVAQLMAMGYVAGQATQGMVPYWAGVVGLAAVILLYETLGGMRAVAWTDTVQGVVMLIALGALAVWLVGEHGGLAGLTRAIAAARPDAVAVPDARACTYWVSSIVLVGTGSVVYPQMIQRVFAANSGRSLGRALAAMTVLPLATTTIVALIGLAAIPRFAALGALAADTVMPRLLLVWAAEGWTGMLLGMLVFVGALAAIMSTADSILLALASVIASDLAGRSGTLEATTRFGKVVALAVMAFCAVVALAPRITLWRLIELKMGLLVQCAPAYMLAARWPGLRADAALAGVAGGTAIVVAALAAGIGPVGGVHVGVLALGANLLVGVGGSLSRRPPAA